MQKVLKQQGSDELNNMICSASISVLLYYIVRSMTIKLENVSSKKQQICLATVIGVSHFGAL